MLIKYSTLQRVLVKHNGKDARSLNNVAGKGGNMG
jgi:hypothetical protein